MSKASNIVLFTEVLKKCRFNNQNEETRNKLHAALAVLLKKAQEKCVTDMMSMQTIGYKMSNLSKDELKEHARNLMHAELESLINSPEFFQTCRDIIVSTQKPTIKQNIMKLDSNQKQSESKDNKTDKLPATKEQAKPKMALQKQIVKKSEKIAENKMQISKSKSSSQKLAPVLKIIRTTLNNNGTPPQGQKRRTSRDSYNIKNQSTAINQQSQTIVSEMNSKIKPSVSIPTEIGINLQGTYQARFQKLKAQVDEAIRLRKTFNMSCYSCVSYYLVNRGWVEKIFVNRYSSEIQQAADRMSIMQLFNNLNHPVHGKLYLRILKSKMLGNHVCDLYWHPRSNIIGVIRNATKPIFVNHLRKRGEYDFTTKIGLCRHMRNLRWNYQQGFADVYFPRTYITPDNELDEFIYDFRVTACMALLKWSVFRYHTSKPLITSNGKVPIDAFYFAILQCIGFIKRCKDCEFKLQYSLQTWNNFIEHYYQCVYKEENFYSSDSENMNELIGQAQEILRRVRNYRTELEFEGNYNIWIVKPDRNCRGQGIHVCRRMCQIKELLQRNTHARYLIQKYIEKPLLIYNTKFDIRQWFLISTSCPLTVWIYKECYLRFSSQQYDLTRFHESIHLTNNSVQCRYKNNSMRDPRLPKDNMWDLYKFQSYLVSIGYSNVWENIIYPKIKQAIMAVLLSVKTDLDDNKPHSFELFGADFMLTPDFQPWLIEINANPAMSPSTSVTARMCPLVLEDVIRVVIDGARSPNCSKGKFELLYKDKVANLPKQPEEGFFIYGTPLSKHYFKFIDESMNKQIPIDKSDSILLSLPTAIDKKIINVANNLDTTTSSPNQKQEMGKLTELTTSPKIISTEKIKGDSANNNIEKNIIHKDVVSTVATESNSIFNIEMTRKIVHMRALLITLMKLLDKETRRNALYNKNNDKKCKSFIKPEDIEKTIHDIRSAMEAMKNGETLNGENISNCGLLSKKTNLLPKTLVNILTIVTTSLYARCL